MHQFYLAPLRGITDYIFRNTFEKYFGKFDYMLAPFIPTVKGDVVNPSHVRDIDPRYNDTARLIPQIIGNDPSDIICLANHCADLGYKAVNLNLGCPHPQITKKKRGCGLLPYPETINYLLDQILPKIKCLFSVKVRLGLSNAQELEQVIPVFNQYALSEVIIHGRTGKQMYEGDIDMLSFQKYRPMINHPVCYNGDIWSLNHYQRYVSLNSDTNRWMSGRGVIRNPFLLEEMRTGSVVKKDITTIRNFHDELFNLNKERLSGPTHLLGKMKELWSYLSESFANSRKILKKIQKRTTVEAYLDSVNETLCSEEFKM